MAKHNGAKAIVDHRSLLEKISGCAYQIEPNIDDAIGIARTAQESALNNELDVEDCASAFGLILYRLEQIQEGHAVIVKMRPMRSTCRDVDQKRKG